MQYYGVDAIVRIVSHLMFIYISFWALQSLRISLSDTQLARLL